MGKSIRCTEAELRRMLRLVAEIAELPRNTETRTRHMLQGICELIGARVGTSVTATHAMSEQGRRITVTGGVDVGLDAADRRRVGTYLQTLEPLDPLSEPLYSRPGVVVTCGREQLLEGTAWHRSAHFNEIRRACGVDDCIASKIQTPYAAGHITTICFHRDLRDPEFSARHWKLIDLFHAETRPLFDAATPQRPGDAPHPTLPPRLDELHRHLLTGDSVKQAARKMGLSVHTVRGYTKVLYRLLNVNSRGELMARFVRV